MQVMYNATTAVVAAYFSGDGANLTNLPAGQQLKLQTEHLMSISPQQMET